MTILDFAQDPELLNLSLSPAQAVTLKAFYGLPLADSEAALFEQLAGRPYSPQPYSELTVVAGARSGKSGRIGLAVALYESFIRRHDYLQRGEKAYVVLVAQDTRAGLRTLLGFVKGAIKHSPLLRQQVKNVEALDNKSLEVELDNDVVLAVYPCNFRAPRGITVACAVADEVSFWRDENSANPDIEVVRALRRGMASVPSARLVKVSTPYAKSGVLWDDFCKRHDLPEVLVLSGATWTFNPSISTKFLEREKAKDPVAFEREFGGEFSEDINSFVSRDAVHACVVPGRLELPPLSDVFYSAFCDPSGGSKDSMTLAISHHHDGRVILDCLRERTPPFSPESVVSEFAETLKSYRVSAVTGDRYGGEWPRERFRAHEISYNVADKNRSELYLALLPAINSGSVELLDSKRLVSQLCGLERRTSRAGRDSIDHMPGQHDDLANSLAGVAAESAKPHFRVGAWGRPLHEMRW